MLDGIGLALNKALEACLTLSGGLDKSAQSFVTLSKLHILLEDLCILSVTVDAVLSAARLSNLDQGFVSILPNADEETQLENCLMSLHFSPELLDLAFLHLCPYA